jgi:hypothetical protein
MNCHMTFFEATMPTKPVSVNKRCLHVRLLLVFDRYGLPIGLLFEINHEGLLFLACALIELQMFV